MVRVWKENLVTTGARGTTGWGLSTKSRKCNSRTRGNAFFRATGLSLKFNRSSMVLLKTPILWIGHKKNKICSNMDDHTKWSQKEKDKYHMMSYVESKIWHKWSYRWNRKTHRHREQSCGCQGGGEVGDGWSRSLGLETPTGIYRMDKHWGSIVEHRGLYSVSWEEKQYEKECMYNRTTLLYSRN